MIGALVLGLFIGVILAIAGIAWRWFTGVPTLVTAGGWAVGPMRWGGWAILIGALIALGEVLNGTRLKQTWGVRIVLSSVGSMLGGLVAWYVWSAFTVPALPTVTEKQP